MKILYLSIILALLLTISSALKLRSKFDENQPDLYDGKTVKNIHGDKAISMLDDEDLINGNPEFVVAYHP